MTAHAGRGTTIVQIARICATVTGSGAIGEDMQIGYPRAAGKPRRHRP